MTNLVQGSGSTFLAFLSPASTAAQASFAFPPHKAAGSSHQQFHSQTSHGRVPGGAEEWYPHLPAPEEQLRGPRAAGELLIPNTALLPARRSPCQEK